MNFAAVKDQYPLAAFAGEKPPAPEWFTQAMSEESGTGSVKVEGVDIEFVTWGEVGKPGILLIHGNFAHAYWWGPLAPMLGRDYRVCAVSLAGMGGSGWRPAYTMELQIKEALAAAEAGQLFAADEAPSVIAHSYGCEVGSFIAAQAGDRFGRAILLDSGSEPDIDHHKPLATKGRSYPTMADALARFRLAPPQDHNNLFILDDIARKGLVQDEDGQWRWRFDVNFWANLGPYSGWDSLALAKCPLAFVYAENSRLISPKLVAVQKSHVAKGTPFICIPDAGHHLMIDQPLAVYAVIRGLIEESRRSLA